MKTESNPKFQKKQLKKTQIKQNYEADRDYQGGPRPLPRRPRHAAELPLNENPRLYLWNSAKKACLRTRTLAKSLSRFSIPFVRKTLQVTKRVLTSTTSDFPNIFTVSGQLHLDSSFSLFFCPEVFALLGPTLDAALALASQVEGNSTLAHSTAGLARKDLIGPILLHCCGWLDADILWFTFKNSTLATTDLTNCQLCHTITSSVAMFYDVFPTTKQLLPLSQHYIQYKSQNEWHDTVSRNAQAAKFKRKTTTTESIGPIKHNQTHKNH